MVATNRPSVSRSIIAQYQTLYMQTLLALRRGKTCDPRRLPRFRAPPARLRRVVLVWLGFRRDHILVGCHAELGGLGVSCRIADALADDLFVVLRVGGADVVGGLGVVWHFAIVGIFTAG